MAQVHLGLKREVVELKEGRGRERGRSSKVR